MKVVYAAEGRGRRRRWRLKENVASHGNASSIELHRHGETYAGNERQPTAEADIKGAPGLNDLNQQGARRIIQQAIEAELATMLKQYSNVKTIDGRWAVVRNGYLPEREIVTAVGPVPVQVPKMRDRSGSGTKFNSAIVPPYVRKSPRVSSSLPWLYLRGVSTGDMGDALSKRRGACSPRGLHRC